jgi:transposase
VDVAPALTAAGRRRGRARGKDDRIDAIAVARLARQEPGLPALSLVGLNADLKLLVDARDQLVVEAGRVRNRLHALLLVLAPGYRTSTGALAKRPALRRARRLIERAAPGEAVRARLALAAIARLEAWRTSAPSSSTRSRPPSRPCGRPGCWPSAGWVR